MPESSNIQPEGAVMIQALERLLQIVSEQWLRLREDGAERRSRELALDEAIEHVVDKTNPRIRALPGYRRKLRDGVGRSLAFSRSLAERIPGPVLLDRDAWADDPQVNALFGSYETLRRAITSPQIRRFVRETPLDDGDCYGALIATPVVRNQLGVALSGDNIQRDVRQTTVSFADHRLLLPGADEQAVRTAAADALMDVLLGIAIEDIASQEERIAEQDQALRRLRIKQRALGPLGAGLDLLGDDSTGRIAEHESLASQIQELERDLARARRGLGTLDDYLTRLDGLLRHPETRIETETERVRLDRMNVVRPHGDAAAELSYLRAYRSGRPGRILMLVHFPRAELIPDSQLLAEVERYVNA